MRETMMTEVKLQQLRDEIFAMREQYREICSDKYKNEYSRGCFDSYDRMLFILENMFKAELETEL